MALCLLLAIAASPAAADLTISQLIVELAPGGSRSADLELVNDSAERSFVAIEPREIIGPGTPGERSIAPPDPDRLGLLASPRRVILEPHQRRRLRIAALGEAPERERVYRVTVKPVAGGIEGEATGLKVLVGYDLLVLARPKQTRQDVRGVRADNRLTITNHGNASIELADGRQCDENGKDCHVLPGKRLYAGASWRQELERTTPVTYRVRSARGWSSETW